ncbi:MAG: MotA/TolQ/ExbB proton channel family protein [Deltaproteobacteria bacterium]|nr:MotA/TolQ/ExbB proton channel family protein [Deltaproteobacteria bacterium]
MLGENLQEIAKVGATGVLYLLIALSVISIGVVAERWWYHRRNKTDIKALAATMGRALRAGDRDGAIAALKKTRAIEAHAVAEALEYYEDGPDAFAQMKEKAMRDRRGPIEAGLLFLGTLGNNAPFIGLFGTVLGIVHSFRELGAASPGAGGAGNMDNVMNGIAEALISTAIGILVAIPAVVAYNVFSKKSQQIEENSGALENVVLATLNRDGGASGAITVTGGVDGTGMPGDLTRLGAHHLGSVVEEGGEA